MYVSKSPFPLVDYEKAAGFGAELFFKYFLDLVSDIRKDINVSDEAKKSDINAVALKIKNNAYPLSINSLIFFLTNFIQFLEGINEKMFFDLVLFLKKFLNCII